MSASEALVRAGVDPERLEVQERPILGPHIFVRCEGHVLSVIGEIDLDDLVATRPAFYGPNPDPLPLRSDVVEIGLMSAGRERLLAEPLRHVPFEEAAAICRAALVGDVDAFRPLYSEEEQG